MTLDQCAREDDVLDALSARRWPNRAAAELRAHVASCPICADLVEVAAALLDEQERGWQEARVPPSGVVWWRAQLRAREDAARAAARPLAFIQGVAASVALWLVVTLLRAVPAADLAVWRTWAAGLIPGAAFTIPDLASLMRLAGIVPISVLCLLAAWLMLAPIAIYFAVVDE
jgi:hypothetical protein